MAVLTTADAIRLGGALVQAVRLGATQVWPPLAGEAPVVALSIDQSPVIEGSSVLLDTAPRPLDQRVVVTGHSILDQIASKMSDGVATLTGAAVDYAWSTGPNPSARGRWDIDASLIAVNGKPGARAELALGADVLIGIEGIRDGSAQGGGLSSDPADYALSLDTFGFPGPPGAFTGARVWHRHAVANGARAYYLPFWSGIFPGNAADPFIQATFTQAQWRAELDVEHAKWMQIADYVNNDRAPGEAPLWIIPLNRLFARLYDDIIGGSLTGITMTDIFADNVHLAINGAWTIGAWIEAALVFAVIYNRDPAEFPRVITAGNFGAGWPTPPLLTEPMRIALTDRIRAVALADPRSGYLPGPPPLAAPVNTSPPTISGSTVEGSTLTVTSNGAWTGNPAPTLARNWQENGVDIPGQTGATLGPTIAGFSYRLRVTATNSQGAATAFSAAIVAQAAATAPAQPAAPALAVDGATQITATITDPSDGGSPITSRDLRYSTDQTAWTTVTDVTSPHAITSLTASTQYFVQVRAVNAIGASAWSASATATTSAAAGADIIAELVTAGGSFAFAIVPGVPTLTQFFVEATGAAATTVAGDGDPVGTIRDMTTGRNLVPGGTVAPTYHIVAGRHWLEMGAGTDLSVAMATNTATSMIAAFAGNRTDNLGVSTAIVGAGLGVNPLWNSASRFRMGQAGLTVRSGRGFSLGASPGSFNWRVNNVPADFYVRSRVNATQDDIVAHAVGGVGESPGSATASNQGAYNVDVAWFGGQPDDATRWIGRIYAALITATDASAPQLAALDARLAAIAGTPA